MTAHPAAPIGRPARAVVMTVVGLLLGAIGLAVWLGHRGSRVAESAVTERSSPARSAAPGPVELPRDHLAWTTVAGAQVPVSAVAGPRDSRGGRARGFSRDSRGAVFAAVHLSLRLAPQVGPVVFGPTLREQVVGGGGDVAALRERVEADYEQARQRAGVAYGGPVGRIFAVVRGYRIDSASSSAVSLRLLIEGPGRDGGSVLVAVVIELRWVDGDWALVAPPAGDWAQVVTVASETSGYVPFGPEGRR